MKSGGGLTATDLLICVVLLGVGCGPPSDRTARSLSEWLSGLEIPPSATVQEFADSFKGPEGIRDQGIIVVRWTIDARDMPNVMSQARRKRFRDISSATDDSTFLADKVRAANYVYTLARGSTNQDWTFVVIDSAASTMHVSMRRASGGPYP